MGSGRADRRLLNSAAIRSEGGASTGPVSRGAHAGRLLGRDSRRTEKPGPASGNLPNGVSTNGQHPCNKRLMGSRRPARPGSVAGWCRMRNGFARPVSRTSARAVWSDIGVLWPGAGGAIVTSSSRGRPVQRDGGGQLPQTANLGRREVHEVGRVPLVSPFPRVVGGDGKELGRARVFQERLSRSGLHEVAYARVGPGGAVRDPRVSGRYCPAASVDHAGRDHE